MRDDVAGFGDVIQSGELTQVEADHLRNKFYTLLSNGIITPLEKASVDKTAFDHIMNRHPEMRSDKMIENISKVLSNPDEIYYQPKQKSNLYISKTIKNIVIVRGNIITSFVPHSEHYLSKQRDKGELRWSKK